MQLIIAALIGTVFAAAFYLLLRRQLQQVLFGLVLMSHGANLLIFTSASLVRGSIPIIEEGGKALADPHPDPLPQALILTAIVISFGITAFALVLAQRAHRSEHDDDLEDQQEPRA
ncbi:MAG: Na+/H+ antiporter subunit C [Candidatus Competibacteraceae bacterium]|nr:Na+/H+ antiporter subunit C [Candidatus Competibacteraceae bacterium]